MKKKQRRSENNNNCYTKYEKDKMDTNSSDWMFGCWDEIFERGFKRNDRVRQGNTDNSMSNAKGSIIGKSIYHIRKILSKLLT